MSNKVNGFYDLMYVLLVLRIKCLFILLVCFYTLLALYIINYLIFYFSFVGNAVIIDENSNGNIWFLYSYRLCKTSADGLITKKISIS